MPCKGHRLSFARRARGKHDQRVLLGIEQMRLTLGKMYGIVNRISLGAHDGACATTVIAAELGLGNCHEPRHAGAINAANHAQALALKFQQARELFRISKAIVQAHQRERSVRGRQRQKHVFRAIRQINRHVIAPSHALSAQTPRHSRGKQPRLTIRIRHLFARGVNKRQEHFSRMRTRRALEYVYHRAAAMSLRNPTGTSGIAGNRADVSP